MPKEAKRFINPLLRPSQAPEQRQATPSRVKETVKRPTKPVETVTEEVIVPPALSYRAETVKEPEVQSDEKVISARTVEEGIMEERRATELPPIEEEFLPDMLSSSMVTPSLSLEEEDRDPRTDIRLQMRETAPESLSPIRSTSPLVADVLPDAVPPIEEREEKRRTNEATHFDNRRRERPTRPGGRRRHGAETFEATHERITLWVDRHLRQSFEELAYQRDMSKASLLNEAINDLLRKYNI